MSQAMEQEGATAAAMEDQGHGGDGQGDDELNYKHHVITKFDMMSDAHSAFEAFDSDCPQMQPLFSVFTPDPQGFRPLTVVLQGRPGVGKSTLAQRILVHWAHGKLYPGMFSYVFFLVVRDLPLGTKSSFAELISREWPNSQVPMTEILSRPEMLLFVVDGFDDMDVDLEDAEMSLCTHWTETQEVSVLICSLLKKVLLPESSLIVTVRDVGVEKLNTMVTSPHYLFIQGISIERRVQLFLEHIKNEDQKLQVLHWVVDNHELMDSCQVPTVGLLLCQALELRVASERALPSSFQVLTGLYTTFLVHQLNPQDTLGNGLSPEEKFILKGLCRMAVEGIWAMKFVFYTNDLDIHQLTEPKLFLLFRWNILLRDSRGDSHFTFLHPSLQEFCAALYYILGGLDTEQEPCPLCVENIKTWKDLRQMSLNTHFIQMKRFLFGLMNKEVVRTLEDLLGCPLALEVRQTLIHWVSLLGQQANTTSPLDFLDVFYCLFETQDEEFVRLALNGCQEVRLTVNRPMDLLVVSFCIQYCWHLQRIHLDIREILLEDESAEAWPVVLQGGQVKPLVTEKWENLCSMLSYHPNLQELDLSGSILSEWAMKTLCSKLRQPACRVQKLIFKGTRIALGLHHFWKTLIINPNIKYVDLESTQLKDEDIGIANEALKHPNCVLQSLRLDHCGLTNTSCQLLSQILLTSTSLRSLSLTGNQVTDQGVQPLCEALKVSPCSLQKLILGSCGLTATSCREVASVLCSNQRLTHLDLSGNRLGAEGMTVLCQALKLVTCALQRLILRDCSLDVVGCGFLALGLMSNRHLTHLSLSMNPLGDDGVNLLCEVMVEMSCHLQDLELVKCGLTAVCSKNLCTAITRNKRLRSLDLAANALGDTGVAALCEGLKQRTVTLRRLGLEACGLTSACCEVLSSALLHNRHLSSLNLMRNNFSPQGIVKLCSAFEHPESKLQVIGMWKWEYPGPTRKLLENLQVLKPHILIGDDWYSFDEDDRYWWKN